MRIALEKSLVHYIILSISHVDWVYTRNAPNMSLYLEGIWYCWRWEVGGGKYERKDKNSTRTGSNGHCFAKNHNFGCVGCSSKARCRMKRKEN